MRHTSTTIVALLFFCQLFCQSSHPTVYLIPGQGSDHRLFSKINLDNEYEIKYINHRTPAKGASMADYAKILAEEIDTTHPFILIGVSLGGMLSVEISEILNPEKVIIISSAKTNKELPKQYYFQKTIPIYKVVPGKVSKQGALILQPIVEPDRKKNKDTFISMLNDKSAKYYERTIAMIIEWDRTEYSGNIIHIHGDNDNTIPIKNVTCNYTIDGGSHMMALTEGDKINKLLISILEDKQ